MVREAAAVSVRRLLCPTRVGREEAEAVPAGGHRGDVGAHWEDKREARRMRRLGVAWRRGVSRPNGVRWNRDGGGR
ncbi:hypothetical protein GUJ93_ZPchr0009g1892 [Zizania palustris]|uniref:Uncharacterized protein n=1 Tax=Zizania palustris TaxID=103762 RepID=A0A8J5S5V8_ZIZPA|nr:hypothetical protein GUJ93_ZPchr0009g1892 [Zizania palustris]